MSKLTAKEFLKIMRESTWQHDLDKKDLYDKYYEQVKRATRLFYGLDLSTKESLQGLGDRDSFENFIRNTSREKIEETFKTFLTEMDTVANELDQEHDKQTKKRFVGTGAIVLIGILSLVPAVLMFGNMLWGWWMPPAISALATLIGAVYDIAFPLRETASDARKGEGASDKDSSPDSAEKPKRVKSQILRICIYTVAVLAIIAFILVCILIKPKATIDFDSAGGTHIEPVVVTQGDTSFLLPTPIREGHSFVSWSLKPASEATEADYFSLQKLEDVFASKRRAVITVHAIWKLNEYDVVYGGSVTVGGFFAKGNELIHLAQADAFAKTGYHCIGFSKSPDATKPEYACGETVKNLGENGELVTLYPILEGIPYRVIYLSNGGSGSMPDTQARYDIPFTIPQETFSKTGYHCIGFATDPNKTVPDYSIGQSVSGLTATDGGAVTLHCIWELNSYTVRYDANGGSGSIPGFSKNGNEKFCLAKTDVFVRTGYRQIGWSLDPNATTPRYSSEQEVQNLTDDNGANVVVYAVWQPHTYTIEYYLNSPHSFLTPTCDPKPLSVTYGAPYQFPVPICKYYKFKGWARDFDGALITDDAGKALANWSIAADENGDKFRIYPCWENISGYTYIYDADTLNQIGASGNYLLICDVNMDGAVWEPKSSFSGVLDGNGHCIYNFSISKTGGLGTETVAFIKKNTGTIQNLTIGKAGVTAYDSKYSVKYNISHAESRSASYLYVAGFVGENSGSLIRCNLVNVGINATFSDKNNNEHLYLFVGGVVAKNNGRISNCLVSDSAVNGYAPSAKNSGDNSKGWLGGICAQNSATLTNCTVQNTVLDLDVRADGGFLNGAGASGAIGGIVGEQLKGVMSLCLVKNNTITWYGSSGSFTSSKIEHDDICGKKTGGTIS